MFVENFRKDFYDKLKGQSVLMLATMEIDSVAAVKIMQYLLQMDCVMYSLVPVAGYEDLKSRFSQYASHIKRVILINCGGGVDLLNALENVSPDTIFFIIDSRRPFSLLNIYDQTKQVRILGNPEDETFPSFDDLFLEMSDDEDESSDEDIEDDEDLFAEERRATRARKRTERVEKAKKRHEFEERRNRIVLEYSDYNYFGKPAALVALGVALEMSRAKQEVVWWSIIGLTDCIRLNKIDKPTYTMLLAFLQDQVTRVAHENENTLFNLKISMMNDIDSYVFRKWSLYESMKVTPNWACTFKLWSTTGEQRFKLFLADSGLPLKDMKQEYEYMDRSIRKELVACIQAKAEKYDLNDWTIGTFEARFGHCFRYTALDVHMAALALLGGSTSTRRTVSEKFHDALCCFGKEGSNTILRGVESTKTMLRGTFQQLKYLLSLDKINVNGTILVANLGDLNRDFNVNISTSYLSLLVRFVQRAFIANSRSTKYKHMPLVLLVPKSEEFLIAIGIPPFSADLTHNVFGKVFEQVALKMKDEIFLNYFDPSICQVKIAHKDHFIEEVVSTFAV